MHRDMLAYLSTSSMRSPLARLSSSGLRAMKSCTASKMEPGTALLVPLRVAIWDGCLCLVVLARRCAELLTGGWVRACGDRLWIQAISRRRRYSRLFITARHVGGIGSAGIDVDKGLLAESFLATARCSMGVARGRS